MDGAKKSELCRGLILENGCTIALFSCCKVVVLEPEGSCFSVVSEGRENGRPFCESHPVRFTPSKYRSIVSLALQFRNYYSETPFIPMWMADIPNSDKRNEGKLTLLKDCGFLSNHGGVGVHWPLEFDRRFVKWTVNGGVEVYSIEGTARLSLCHLGKRLSVTFAVDPTKEDNAMWGYSAEEVNHHHTPSSELKKDGQVALITQLYSLRQIPSCFEIPARLALMTYHTRFGLCENGNVERSTPAPTAQRQQQQQQPDKLTTGLKLSDSSRNMQQGKSRQVPRCSNESFRGNKISEEEEKHKPLPKYSHCILLPHSPPPSTPFWRSVDTSDGVRLHQREQNNHRSGSSVVANKTYVYDENDPDMFIKFKELAAHANENDEEHEALLAMLLPSELMSLVKKACENSVVHKKKKKDETNEANPNHNLQVTSTYMNHHHHHQKEEEEDEHGDGFIAAQEDMYPVSRHCSVVEWSPSATYRAFSLRPHASDDGADDDTDSNGGGSNMARKKAKCVVEITIHADDSVVLVEGDYVTHCSRNDNHDEFREAGGGGGGDKNHSLDLTVDMSTKVVRERCYHINMTEHITIDNGTVRYRLGPFVRKAINLSSQFCSVYSNHSRRHVATSSSSSHMNSATPSHIKPHRNNHFLPPHAVRTVSPLVVAPILIHPPTSPAPALISKWNRLTPTTPLDHGIAEVYLQHSFSSSHMKTSLVHSQQQPPLPPSAGYNAGVVIKQELAHCTLSAYLDGSCRACFKDRTIARLTWLHHQTPPPHPSRYHTSSSGTTSSGSSPHAVASIHVITPIGGECVADYYSDGSVSSDKLPSISSRKVILNSVMPHVRLLIKFATWAVASPEERQLIDAEVQEQQLRIAREIKKNDLFVSRQKLELEIKENIATTRKTSEWST
jgi:hypothetical protein